MQPVTTNSRKVIGHVSLNSVEKRQPISFQQWRLGEKKYAKCMSQCGGSGASQSGFIQTSLLVFLWFHVFLWVVLTTTGRTTLLLLLCPTT